MKFPSLKGFDFGLDLPALLAITPVDSGFHPSKGSTSAWIGGSTPSQEPAGLGFHPLSIAAREGPPMVG